MLLNGEDLLQTVRDLADGIGPRPPGHAEEEQARTYLLKRLKEIGITDTEKIIFSTYDSWDRSTITPTALAAAANVLWGWRRFC